MRTPDDPSHVDYESKDEQEAASKKQHPNDKPGRGSNRGVSWREQRREKEKGEPLGDWVHNEFRIEVLAETGDFLRC